MNRKILLLLLVTFFVDGTFIKHHFVLKSEADAKQNPSVDDDWWRTGVFYQIYPRSFKDSDGDGIGDLQGIISKLDHLKDMGITAAWLSPINKSPGIDQGYDISDYRDIDPIFGTLDNMKLLLKKAHELNIKIIMDFVPNHTSDQHEWFIKSVNNDTDYSDYYIWKDKTSDGNPPNNWISTFDGSAWNFSSTRNQYYLHQFSWGQPDLNFRNPNVVAAMKDVLAYWMDLGVDGFRMDAVPRIFEDSEFKDEPLSGVGNIRPDQYGYLKHIYTSNLDETYDMVYQFRKFMDDYNKNKSDYTRIMMTEGYTDTAEQLVSYYGNNTSDGAHFAFNFNLITQVSNQFTIDEIITAVNRWLSYLPKKYVSNWVLGNHDRHRVATRLGPSNVDAFNMLIAFLPGIQNTYMGEEIGMEDGQVNCSQSHDPQAIKNCSTFDLTSRDFERTPFHWDDSKNAGFSSGNTTWLPVSHKYATNNLKVQNVPGIESHYNVFKKMIAFRKHFANITYDAISLIKLSDSVLQIIRTTNKGEYIYLFNSADHDETVNVYTNNIYLVVKVTGINSKFSYGHIVQNPLTLSAHDSIVFQGLKLW